MKKMLAMMVVMCACTALLIGCPPADNTATGNNNEAADNNGAAGNGGTGGGASVNHDDPKALVAAYIKASNSGDGKTVVACMEPVEAPANTNGATGDPVTPPEFPKTTLKALEVDPWTSEDGEWMAFGIEMSSVASAGAEPTVMKYGQWVVKKDGKWYIATTSAANAPMDPTNSGEGSYMAWSTALQG